ncbi:MAG: polyprenyl synthetase family protein, partial [Paracoccaceae bacterium]
AAERAFWVRVIEKGVQEEGDLGRALEIMARHGAMQAARDAAVMWAGRAKAALAECPEHELRGMLEDLADYVVARLN